MKAQRLQWGRFPMNSSFVVHSTSEQPKSSVRNVFLQKSHRRFPCTPCSGDDTLLQQQQNGIARRLLRMREDYWLTKQIYIWKRRISKENTFEGKCLSFYRWPKASSEAVMAFTDVTPVRATILCWWGCYCSRRDSYEYRIGVCVCVCNCLVNTSVSDSCFTLKLHT